ncbi:MAG: sensor histidine kinase [Alkalispirochaeta sp.]
MFLARLDTYTMMVLIAFGHFLILLFLLAYQWGKNRSRAFNFLIAARVLHGIGWALISARGVYADWLSAGVGNVALIFGVAVESIAFLTYRERSRRVEGVFLTIASVGSALFVIAARTPPLIVGFGGAVAFLLNTPLAILLIKRSRGSVLLKVAGALFAVASGALLVRSVYGFLGVLDFRVNQAPLQSSFYLPVFSVLLTSSIALVLLLKEQDEKEIRVSHEKYNTLFRSNPSAIILAEPESGVVLEANPQILHLTGYTAEEIRGRTFTELGLWKPEEGAAVESSSQPDGGLVAHEIDAVHRDGGMRTWLVSAAEAQLGDRTLLAFTVQDITARKSMELKMHGLLAEKEVLLREVHHRIRNNLTQLIGLLHLHKGRSDESRNGEPTASIFEDAINRIHGMQALYDHVYTRKDYTNVDARGYVELLVDRLKSTFANGDAVEVSLEIDEIALTPKNIAPFGQLLNELFTNSMKHAFKDRRSGSIRIALHRDGDALLMEYDDDGPGLPDNGGEASQESFGWFLIEALTDQLGATWTVGTPPGVHYRLHFAQ